MSPGTPPLDIGRKDVQAIRFSYLQSIVKMLLILFYITGSDQIPTIILFVDLSQFITSSIIVYSPY
jgi:hypothetical protein